MNSTCTNECSLAAPYTVSSVLMWLCWPVCLLHLLFIWTQRLMITFTSGEERWEVCPTSDCLLGSPSAWAGPTPLLHRLRPTPHYPLSVALKSPPWSLFKRRMPFLLSVLVCPSISGACHDSEGSAHFGKEGNS